MQLRSTISLVMLLDFWKLRFLESETANIQTRPSDAYALLHRCFRWYLQRTTSENASEALCRVGER
jgi:hypothetical protein